MKPKYCPCCGSKNVTTENTITEGVVRCMDCFLTMIRRHPPKDFEMGVALALNAWNTRNHPKMKG